MNTINYVYVPELAGKIPDTYAFSWSCGNHSHTIEHRPWGSYEILYDNTNCKVKKITIHPGQSPSYQVHGKRDECWQVISGIGVARINDELIDVKYGDIITVKRGVPHSILNSSTIDDLIFIEIQTGISFEEDDIIRLEDKYGR